MVKMAEIATAYVCIFDTFGKCRRSVKTVRNAIDD